MSEDAFPDRSMEHQDKIAWMIETKGWAIEPVPPRPDADPPMPGYAYTIGLESSFAFPEVVLFGLTPVAASGLAELLIGFIADGADVPLGVIFTGLLDNDLRCALLPIERDTYAELFAAATTWHKGSEYRVLQLGVAGQERVVAVGVGLRAPIALRPTGGGSGARGVAGGLATARPRRAGPPTVLAEVRCGIRNRTPREASAEGQSHADDLAAAAAQAAEER